MTKQALGLLKYGTTVMPWGRGAAAGGFVFLSGIDGVTDEHGRPAHGVAAQALVTLNRVHRLLADAGAEFEDIVQFDQFLADPADRAEYMRVRDEWLAEHAPKLLSERSYASLLIYPPLATPEMRVEIRVVAYLGA